MNRSKAVTKLLRVLQFRKHIKELTKRLNKDGCYDFVSAKTDLLPTNKKSSKFHLLRPKKKRDKSECRLTTRIQTNMEYMTLDNHGETLKNKTNSYEHLSRATSTSPANLPMIISQSYKPLHAKSTQFNKNTIAVTKGTLVNALYVISNWIFIEIPETGRTGLIPIYCVNLCELSNPTVQSSSKNNISLLNVSNQEKSCYSHPPSAHSHSYSMSTPRPGRFISSIGPCHVNNESQATTHVRSRKAATYTQHQFKDESVLSQQISNVSLHGYDKDEYGTLNMTPRKNLSFSVVDNEPVSLRSKNRLRVIENYQRKFVGDISVLESEVVELVNPTETSGDWRLVKRGDGQQGYIPKHILTSGRDVT